GLLEERAVGPARDEVRVALRDVRRDLIEEDVDAGRRQAARRVRPEIRHLNRRRRQGGARDLAQTIIERAGDRGDREVVAHGTSALSWSQVGSPAGRAGNDVLPSNTFEATAVPRLAPSLV